MEPYLDYDFKHKEPTRDSPTEVMNQIRVIRGSLRQLVVYSGITGEIFVRLAAAAVTESHVGATSGLIGPSSAGVDGTRADATPSVTAAIPPFRVGGNVRTPTKIKDVSAVYPQAAATARVQGVVIVETTIDPEGAVADVRVLRSIPLLDQAALAAVRQWRFSPTIVDGKAVPVIMTHTVNVRP